MAQPSHNIAVYLEIGEKRTFAGAMDWPGWCRSGRDLDELVEHVMAADLGYLARLAWKEKMRKTTDLGDALEQLRQAMLNALNAAARGGTPERGPRGGVIWTPRYFVRRVAWHVIDHIWEIEDRVA